MPTASIHRSCVDRAVRNCGNPLTPDSIRRWQWRRRRRRDLSCNCLRTTRPTDTFMMERVATRMSACRQPIPAARAFLQNCQGTQKAAGVFRDPSQTRITAAKMNSLSRLKLSNRRAVSIASPRGSPWRQATAGRVDEVIINLQRHPTMFTGRNRVDNSFNHHTPRLARALMINEPRRFGGRRRSIVPNYWELNCPNAFQSLIVRSRSGCASRGTLFGGRGGLIITGGYVDFD